MARKYRNFHKRREYGRYAAESSGLTESLRRGEISQQEFDERHEKLDRIFNKVR